MSVAKFTISVEDRLLEELDRLVQDKVFRSRSHAVQVAMGEKIARMERSRLAAACAKLDPVEEVTMAEEGFRADRETWPEYEEATSIGLTLTPCGAVSRRVHTRCLF